LKANFKNLKTNNDVLGLIICCRKEGKKVKKKTKWTLSDENPKK
jgi:hypothetical protein